MGNPPAQFNDLYFPSGALAALDDKAAFNLGYGYDPHSPGRTGTTRGFRFSGYERMTFFRAATRSRTASCEFSTTMEISAGFSGTAKTPGQSNPSTLTFPCAPNTTFPGNATPLTKLPTLILDVYDESNVPSGATPGDFYIRPHQPTARQNAELAQASENQI